MRRLRVAANSFQSNEAHLPAQPHQTQAHARLPRPHGDPGRPAGPEEAPEQGAGPIVALEGLRFPREARLLKAAEFRAVFRTGRRAHAGPLLARLKQNGRDRARLGMAVGRKAAGNAVGRNRTRRQIRESFRIRQRRLAGLDVVVSLAGPGRSGTLDLRRCLPRLWNEVERKAGGPWNG